MTTEEQLSRLSQLLKVEKEEDFQQYQRKILHTSVQDRKKEGVCWYPIKLQSQRIGTGDRIVIQVEKPIEDENNHVFQVGSVVSLFNNVASQERANYSGGVVSYLRKNVMKIVLNSYDLPDWVDQGKLGVDLMFDEATYREMDKAISRLKSAEEGRIAELREIFYGEQRAVIRKGHHFKLPSLNERQNDALTNILNSADLAIIHGPPGTGKTTTLVQSIKEVVKEEKQVLVSAPSNAAVDLLVEKLTELDLNVLRLGHPARVSGAAVEKSLDYKITQHPSHKQLKEVRRRSEELKKLGLKYKRNFGHAERKQRRMILDEARNLKLEADHTEHYITTDLLNSAQVVACTLINGNHQLIRARTFKTVFIDEASQALEPACWIPVMKGERVVLAGDHYQLPPTIKSIEAAKKGLEVTLFEKGINHQEVDTMLRNQYRMLPEIMEFPSEMFYSGELQADDSVLFNKPFDDTPFEFIDTAGCGYDEEVEKQSLSTFNSGEAELLVKHLTDFLEKNFEEITQNRRTIAVIAPYKAQIRRIEEKVDADAFFENFKGLLSINTVDAFQGQERDVIYISLVRSNEKGEIGFLKETRRMNVAMTRAKVKLVMIGDSTTVCQHEFFDALITHVQSRAHYRSAFELIY